MATPTGATAGPSVSAAPTAFIPTIIATPSLTQKAAARSRLPVRVTLVRAGGFAGVRQSIVIQRNGSWTYQNQWAAEATHGRLTATQISALVPLLTDPRLPGAARQTHNPGLCADGFEYSLTAGGVRAAYLDCGGQAGPVVAIVRVITQVTPM